MGEAGEEGLIIGLAGAWWLRPSSRLRGLADLLVKAEPLWVIPALAFTCTSLLWGLGWSWVGLVIAAIAFPLRLWRLGHLSHHSPFGIPVALFLVASLVGLSVSSDRGLSLRAFQSCLACILLYCSLVNIPHPSYMKWGFAFASACVFVAGLLAFREGFTPPPMSGDFGTWVQGQVQHLPQVPRLSCVANPIMSTAHGLAIALEMVLLPLLALTLFAPKPSLRAAGALASLPLVTLLLLLGSQGAWLAVLCGVAILLVWRRAWAALPVAAVAGLGYLGYWQGWIDPRCAFSQFGPLHSLRVRMDLWVGAADVIRHHPIAGCGLGCLGKYSTGPLLSPHSAYLQYYADAGLLGAVALLVAAVAGTRMAVVIRTVHRNHPWYGFAVGIVAACAAVAVHGLFEGSPAGIIAETADGYFYIVSPVTAILAGVFTRTARLMDETDLEAPGVVLPP